jgi:hypothetical protein
MKMEKGDVHLSDSPSEASFPAPMQPYATREPFVNHLLLHVGDLIHPFAPAFVEREAVLTEDTPARNPDQPVSHGPDSLALFSLTSEAEDASPT